uniref:Uncharacterized protein n=1 Tax=Glossina palpalis gambiensis TaxID=67801 RepID=A0A1B0B610_9MUSC
MVTLSPEVDFTLQPCTMQLRLSLFVYIWFKYDNWETIFHIICKRLLFANVKEFLLIIIKEIELCIVNDLHRITSFYIVCVDVCNICDETDDSNSDEWFKDKGALIMGTLGLTTLASDSRLAFSLLLANSYQIHLYCVKLNYFFLIFENLISLVRKIMVGLLSALTVTLFFALKDLTPSLQHHNSFEEGKKIK